MEQVNTVTFDLMDDNCLVQPKFGANDTVQIRQSNLHFMLILCEWKTICFFCDLGLYVIYLEKMQDKYLFYIFLFPVLFLVFFHFAKQQTYTKLLHIFCVLSPLRIRLQCRLVSNLKKQIPGIMVNLM